MLRDCNKPEDKIPINFTETEKQARRSKAKTLKNQKVLRINQALDSLIQSYWLYKRSWKSHHKQQK